MSDCKSLNADGCRQVVEYSMEYIEGALPNAEQEHFRQHLEACPECVSFFETYKETPRVSRECFAVSMPENVKNAVGEFLRQRCKP